ncbi:MAG: PRC-barrel domain-containing protein [Nanoarchaeota archaeon]|nr:PRC-barrel domain-containing protein [Nanoarchaeota archaeon]
MLKIKQITDVFDMQVFTDTGDYFGDVEEAILQANKIYGWRIRATRNSFLTKLLGGAKGVVVPHNLVKAIGDVMVVSKSAVPSYEEEETAQGSEY